MVTIQGQLPNYEVAKRRIEEIVELSTKSEVCLCQNVYSMCFVSSVFC